MPYSVLISFSSRICIFVSCSRLLTYILAYASPCSFKTVALIFSTPQSAPNPCPKDRWRYLFPTVVELPWRLFKTKVMLLRSLLARLPCGHPQRCLTTWEVHLQHYSSLHSCEGIYLPKMRVGPNQMLIWLCWKYIQPARVPTSVKVHDNSEKGRAFLGRGGSNFFEVVYIRRGGPVLLHLITDLD